MFGEATGDTIADRILAALQVEPDGLTRTQIRELVGGRESDDRIEVALGLLERYGLAEMEEETDTGGRPAERWHATTATKEE